MQKWYDMLKISGFFKCVFKIIWSFDDMTNIAALSGPASAEASLWILSWNAEKDKDWRTGEWLIINIIFEEN